MESDPSLSPGDDGNLHGFQWMVLPDGGFQACGQTRTRLPAGAYSCTQDCYGRSQIYRQRCKLPALPRLGVGR